MTSNSEQSTKSPTVIELLSPTGDLDALVSTSVEAYKSVNSAAESLLTRASIDLSAFASSVNLRELIINATNTYKAFTQGEVELCERLLSYSDLLNAILTDFTIEEISQALAGTLAAFQKDAKDKSEVRMKQATEIVGYIEEIDSKIEEGVTAIANLNTQVSNMESQLANLKIGETLVTALKKLFKLVDDPEGALVQLATILGIGLSVLRGDFASLYKNRKELENFIEKLKTLETNLVGVKTDLTALIQGMTVGTQSNIIMLGVWDTMAESIAKLGQLPNKDDELNQVEKLTIGLNWQTMAATARRAKATLTDTLDGSRGASTARRMLVSSMIPERQPILTFPESSEEIKFLSLALRTDTADNLINPKKYAALSNIGARAEIAERYVSRMTTVAAAETNEENTAELEALIRTFGSSGQEKNLEALPKDCSAVINAFNDILKQPFLQNLQVLNPFRADNPSEAEYLDIRTMVQRYKGKYDVLEMKTKECMRSLAAYANIQIVILPIVTLVGAEAEDPDSDYIDVEMYLQANAGPIKKYQETATSLRNEHDLFNKAWALARTNLRQALNESETKAKELKKVIEDKLEEMKKNTLFGVLKIIGGVLAFAIGFIAPFLIPVAWGAAGALLYYGIQDLIQNGKLQEAIAELNMQIDTAVNTADKLRQLEGPFDVVTAKLVEVLSIWNNITQALTNISTKIDSLSAGLQPVVLNKLWRKYLPDNLLDWTTTKTNCEAYASMIGG